VKLSRKNRLPEVSHNEIAMASKTKNRMMPVLYFFIGKFLAKVLVFLEMGKLFVLFEMPTSYAILHS
jgi:hypothetical protein